MAGRTLDGSHGAPAPRPAGPKALWTLIRFMKAIKSIRLNPAYVNAEYGVAHKFDGEEKLRELPMNFRYASLSDVRRHNPIPPYEVTYSDGSILCT